MTPESTSGLKSGRLLIGLVVLLCLCAGAAWPAVWPTTAQWDQQWELRYSDWIRERYRPDFFIAGPYADIPQDCADSSYFARLLFAYEHGLRFLIRDPAWEGQGSQRGESFAELILEHGPDSPYALVRPFIDSETSDFDHLPPDRRLRAFIDFVGAVVWTRSLVDDTYPVSIDRQWFRPGVVAVLPRRRNVEPSDPDNELPGQGYVAGHAQIVVDVDDLGVVHYLKSTMPAKVQVLKATTLNSFNPSPEGGSFRYWKQPADYWREESELPGYGLDQFEIDRVFEDSVQARLAVRQETRQEKIDRLGSELCAQLQQRVPVVIKAWRHKLKIGLIHCMGYEEYDIHSTPLRDGKLRTALEQLTRASGIATGQAEKLSRTIDGLCDPIEYLPGRTVPAGSASLALLHGSASSDPNQPPQVRWGLDAGSDSGCPVYY